MTQEEKQLLFKDLCARLQYKIKINVDDIGLFIPRLKYIDGITCHFYECAWTKFIDEIKPYLRPISSMTKEEQKEFVKFHCVNICPMILTDMLTLDNESKMFDWLNSHHLDYHGLIGKGLALEAPEDMYSIK